MEPTSHAAPDDRQANAGATAEAMKRKLERDFLAALRRQKRVTALRCRHSTDRAER